MAILLKYCPTLVGDITKMYVWRGSAPLSSKLERGALAPVAPLPPPLGMPFIAMVAGYLGEASTLRDKSFYNFQNQCTPLHVAVYKCHYNVIKTLMED